ncbi:MAG: hypothetical protein ACRDZY_19810, partial [Acidimicrobiales bacterium]
AQVADVGLAAGQPGTIELPAGGTATVRVGVAHRPGGPGDAPWPDAAGLGGDHLAVRVAAAWVRVGGAVSRSSGTPAGSAGAGSAGAGSGLGSGSQKASSPGTAGTAGAVVARSFADLPRTVLPGQAVTADVVLAATTASGQPLPPGRYRVTFGLVQQGVGPFPSGPASTASVTVTLRSA